MTAPAANRAHDEAAERSLLAAWFLDPECIPESAREPSEFYIPAHAAVADAVLGLAAEGAAIDEVTVCDRLTRSGKIGAVGGLAFLAGLAAGALTSANAAHYAGIVRRHAMTRRVLREVSAALHSGEEGEELLARVLASASAIDTGTADTERTMSELTREALDHLDRTAKGEVVSGVPTGFPDLDEKLGGISYGNVTLLAGRPSMGKSSIARCIADNVSARGEGVHYFSLEDSGLNVALRSLSQHTRVPVQGLVTGKIKRGDLGGFGAGVNATGARRSWLVDEAMGLSSAEIAMRVRRRKRELNTKLVVVDYIGLMREKGDATARVTAAIQGLAEMARSEQVAVLALSQLSRKCEDRDDKRPVMADLRDSGELEQCAYAIMFAYRDEVYNAKTNKPGIVELLLRKNKNGPIGFIDMAWDGATTSMRNLSRRVECHSMGPYR